MRVGTDLCSYLQALYFFKYPLPSHSIHIFPDEYIHGDEIINIKGGQD
jgi:hypothetical protein